MPSLSRRRRHAARQSETHVGEAYAGRPSSSVLKMADACLVSWSPREGADVDNIMFYDGGWRAHINWVFVLREIILAINYTRISGIEFHPECFPLYTNWTRQRLTVTTVMRSEEGANYGIATLIVNRGYQAATQELVMFSRSLLLILRVTFPLISRHAVWANSLITYEMTANYFPA